MLNKCIPHGQSYNCNDCTTLVLPFSEKLELSLFIWMLANFLLVILSFLYCCSRNCSCEKRASKSAMGWQNKKLAFVLSNTDEHHETLLHPCAFSTNGTSAVSLWTVTTNGLTKYDLSSTVQTIQLAMSPTSQDLYFLAFLRANSDHITMCLAKEYSRSHEWRWNNSHCEIRLCLKTYLFWALSPSFLLQAIHGSNLGS